MGTDLQQVVINLQLAIRYTKYTLILTVAPTRIP